MSEIAAGSNPEFDVCRMLGKRWVLPILKSISSEAARFAEIKKALAGISGTMLSERLRELEREGLVTKKIHCSRVEYRLTASARELEAVLAEFGRWHIRHRQLLIAN